MQFITHCTWFNIKHSRKGKKQKFNSTYTEVTWRLPYLLHKVCDSLSWHEQRSGCAHKTVYFRCWTSAGCTSSVSATFPRTLPPTPLAVTERKLRCKGPSDRAVGEASILFLCVERCSIGVETLGDPEASRVNQ